MFRFILLFLLISTIATAQNIDNGVDFSNGKGLLQLKNINNRNHFFGVENAVINQPNQFYRFWNTTYCIEVWNSNNTVNGRGIFAVQNLDNKLEYYRKIFPLDQQQTTKIFELIKSYDLQNLSTDSKISGWTGGFDGNIFGIESNINGNYVYKSYWTPKIQNVPEATRILSFSTDINKVININELVKKFHPENEFLCFVYYGAHYGVLNILNKRKIRKWEKEKP